MPTPGAPPADLAVNLDGVVLTFREAARHWSSQSAAGNAARLG
jgi:hypothetical protein